MEKDERFFSLFISITSFCAGLLLSIVHLCMLPSGIKGLSLSSIGLIHVIILSFAFLFILQLVLMKCLGYRLLGYENRKVQGQIITRMTYIVFALLFFNSEAVFFEEGKNYLEILTSAFLFSMFLSGGVCSIMLWGLSDFLTKKKDVEKKKECLVHYGMCFIEAFEPKMNELNNALYALSKVEEDLSQEEIILVNQKTKEVQDLFAVYQTMSIRARKEVEEDILSVMNTVIETLEEVHYTKDETAIRLIKRKAKRINTKTV